MKLQITLYGSAEYFGKKDAAGLEMTLGEIGRVFRLHLIESFLPTAIGIPEVKISINQEKMPIVRTFVADCTLESMPYEIPYEKLKEIAEKIGNAWTDFVRSFIDSSGLIAFRVAAGETWAKWSPHGAGL